MQLNTRWPVLENQLGFVNSCDCLPDFATFDWGGCLKFLYTVKTMIYYRHIYIYIYIRKVSVLKLSVRFVQNNGYPYRKLSFGNNSFRTRLIQEQNTAMLLWDYQFLLVNKHTILDICTLLIIVLKAQYVTFVLL